MQRPIDGTSGPDTPSCAKASGGNKTAPNAVSAETQENRAALFTVPSVFPKKRRLTVLKPLMTGKIYAYIVYYFIFEG
ncbi:hypothetical protein AA14362_2486 [Acetobacter cerevisiae DSM 14362]|nr:hypothetical protein AA14362_2486 [Acetobacter cerevisiae DSM 14362]